MLALLIASTNVVFILRSKGIETVVLSGFLTNCCVESTMRSAYEKGMASKDFEAKLAS